MLQKLLLTLALRTIVRFVKDSSKDNDLIIAPLMRLGFSYGTAQTLVWYLGEVVFTLPDPLLSGDKEIVQKGQL